LAERADDLHEVVVLRYGTRRTTRGDVFLNYAVYAADDAPIDMDYFVWVVRNDRHTVLVDTGFSAASGARRHRTMLMSPIDAWQRMGVDLGAEVTVVLTHGHYDHTGNLAQLPVARVVVAERELDFWLSPMAARAQFRHSAEPADLVALAAARDDGRVRTFSGRLQLAPGIEVIEVGGHTPGQAMVLVQTSDGPVLLASDAVHYYEELASDMPFTHVADLVGMYQAFDRITGMLRSGEVAHLVAGHDPHAMDRFPPDERFPDFARVIGRCP
jgi:glyoxylase-like metal-dependent hydrolase (beta-lactamase superfamily II)